MPFARVCPAVRRAALPPCLTRVGPATALAALLLVGSAAARDAALLAQQGVVAGTVVRTGSLLPVEGAQVQVQGTQLGAVTDAAGRFRIAGLAGEQVTLQVRRLSFQPTTQVARVGDLAVRIALTEVTVRLDEIVVTGTAGGEQRRAVGNAVVTIDAAQDLERSAAPNLGSLIQSRAPGVIITPNTGRVGAGPTIQIRGRSTLSLSSEPIVYIDGVRVNNATNQGPTGSTAGGASFGAQNSQVASRLNDLNPEDIESIEIIKGPAAATIYGTEAANGVIQIITKRGATGQHQWTARIQQGAVWFQNAEGRIPTNYAANPQTGEIESWNPIAQERERGTPIFRRGHTQSYNLALAGGTGPLTYYISGTLDDDEGVEPNNFGRSFSGHVNLGVAPSERVDVNTSLHLVRLSHHLGVDAGLSSMLGISAGHPRIFPASRGFLFAPPEVSQQLFDNAQDVNRFTGGVTVNHRPIDWFSHRVILGIDHTADDSRALERYATPELRPFFTAALGGQTTADGRIGQTIRDHSFLSGDYSATATRALTAGVTSATSVGAQLVRKQLKSSFLSGIVFPGPGVETVSGTSVKGTPSQNVVVNTTLGMYAQQRFGWNDRLFVTGAVRVDNNSAFGEDLDLVTYPKLSATWVMSEEPFWSTLGGTVNTFKLRAAYGQSGQQPDAFSALRTVVNAPRADGSAGVTPGTLGNPDLKPERGSEFEVGFEAGLFERLSLDATYYTRRTRDAILERSLAPSSGFSGSQLVNIGETSNQGVELLARYLAVATDRVTWEIGANFSTNRDRIEDMGGVSPGTGLFRNAEGYPIGGFWTKRIASAERNPTTHAVTNVVCENGPPSDGTPVPCAQALAVFVGTPTPKVLGALTNSVTIANRLTFYAMLDTKRGHKLFNSNNANRCAFGVCEARHFPEQFSTEYLAGITQAATTAGVQDQYIEDASFVKLREVSVTYQLPERWLARTGVSRAAFVVAGRNLATWTNYTGIDPEVRLAVPQDQGLLPALTQLVTSLNLSF